MKKVKKLLAGFASSMLFFGNNIYAVTSEGATSGGGINFGAIIGVVLIVLVLLLGYKMDKAAEGDNDSEPKKKKKSKKSKKLEDELDANLDADNQNEYAPISEDMPYEEEAGEGYAMEETTVSAPAQPIMQDTEEQTSFETESEPEPVQDTNYESSFSDVTPPEDDGIDVIPQPVSEPMGTVSDDTMMYDSSSVTSFDKTEEDTTSGFSSDDTDFSASDYSSSEIDSVDSDDSFSSFSTDDTNDIDSSDDYGESYNSEFSGVSFSSDEVMNEIDSLPDNEDDSINYTSFDASSSTVEDEISKLDDFNQSDTSDFDDIEPLTPPSEEQEDSYDTQSDEEDAEPVSETSSYVVPEDEFTSFSFDNDFSSSADSEESESNDTTQDSEYTTVEEDDEPQEEPSQTESNVNNSDDDEIFDLMLENLDAEIDGLDDIDEDTEEKVSQAMDEYRQKVDTSSTSFGTDNISTPVFGETEDEREDVDIYASSNSADDEDNIDYVKPYQKPYDPNERDPETLVGFGSSNDVIKEEPKEKEESKISNPIESEGFSFAKEDEKSDKDLMSDEELVASDDLDNGFLNQMEANFKKNQQDRLNK